MKRLRLALAVVALALAVPVGLLVLRALESVELERRVGHEAVAARAFDEMERRLSRYLEEEEARPIEGYLEVDADPGPGGADFAVAHFEVDPGGRVRVSGAAESRATLRASLEEAWSSPASDVERKRDAKLEEEPRRTAEQTPGTTVPLRELDDVADGLARRDAPTAGPDEQTRPEPDRTKATPYELLGSLNRAAEERSLRQAARREQYAKKSAESARSSAPTTVEEGRPSPAEPRAARAPAPVARAKSRDAPPGPPSSGAGSAAGREREAGVAAVSDAEAPQPPEPAPLVGRSWRGRLLLHRSVARPDGAHVQGVVVDLERLGRWLEVGVLGDTGLAEHARAEFLPVEESARAPDAGGFVYQHRFAEPFDGSVVRLSLAPLPGIGDATPVYGLALLVLVVAAVGLAAVYRMVSVVVDFADRRQSFVAAVSHELKTPLTAIRMYAEMLRDGMVETGEKRDRTYRILTDESERLSRLVDNVLEFSRLERGTREMAFVVGPLGPVVEEAVQRLRPHAEREGFELGVRVESGLPPVRFDRDALLQILFNLVDNALKYAGDASRREIRIEVAREPDGRRVGVWVRDFGPGVGRAHLGRIFEPFYRSGDELTRSARGTGIGLALVKELGERMGAAVHGGNDSAGGFRAGLAFEPAPGSPG